MKLVHSLSLTFLWLLLAFNSRQTLAESTVSFLCKPHPCQVDKFHETGVKITAGIINKGDSESGELKVALQQIAGPGPGSYNSAYAHYPETLASGAQYHSGTKAITAMRLPGGYRLDDLEESGQVSFVLWLLEKVSEDWTLRDRVFLRPKNFFPLHKVGGDSTLKRIFLDGRDGNPTIENVDGDEVDSDEVVIRIPRIVNSGPDPVTISRVKLGHFAEAHFWGQSYWRGLDEQDLSITMALLPNRYLERLSVGQRAVLGFAPPGDPYWTKETVDSVGRRYAGMDMGPYKEALTLDRL